MPDRWDGDRTITVITACEDANGSPAFVVTKVDVSYGGYEEGEHYSVAETALDEDSYDGPYRHFDEFEAPAWLMAQVPILPTVEVTPEHYKLDDDADDEFDDEDEDFEDDDEDDDEDDELDDEDED